MISRWWSCGGFTWSRARASTLAAAAIVAATVAPAAAQSPAPTPAADEQPAATPPSTNPFEHIRFGATVEGYYQYNWNRPPDRINLLRAYDTRANVFGLQQTAIVVESVTDVAAGRRFGARIDLQFGQATETVQGSPANEPRPDVYRNIWQAYGTYVFPVGKGLQADFGKYASNLGYETNYAKDNDQFSRAYLFNFLPFYHSGLRLTLPATDRVTLLYMLCNGIQQTEDFNDFKSHQIAATIKPLGTVSLIANYYFGQEQPDGGSPEGPDGFFRVLDTYVTFTPTPRLSLGLDLSHTTNEVREGDDALALDGLGAYARYQLRGPAALAFRYERLDDEGLFSGVPQILQEVTATAEYKFADGFLMRGEFRRDISNVNFFTGPAAGSLRRHQNTLTAGLVWWFGNKTGEW